MMLNAEEVCKGLKEEEASCDSIPIKIRAVPIALYGTHYAAQYATTMATTQTHALSYPAGRSRTHEMLPYGHHALTASDAENGNGRTDANILVNRSVPMRSGTPVSNG